MKDLLQARAGDIDLLAVLVAVQDARQRNVDPHTLLENLYKKYRLEGATRLGVRYAIQWADNALNALEWANRRRTG